MSSLQAAQSFISWLQKSGGSFNDALELKHDGQTGISVFATQDIDVDSTLVSCPAELAITVETSRHALASLYPESSNAVEGWNERMLVAVYVVLHWLHPQGPPPSDSVPDCLSHRPYIDALPPADTLLVPLLWSPDERDLLRGTNLFGTVADQDKERDEEVERIREVVPEVTKEQYILATAYISSRAFPSRLLSLPSSDGETRTNASEKGSIGQEESYPVLLPGLDLFNHSRGTPITWLSSPSPSSTTTASSNPPSAVHVSFQNPSAIKADQEVFNNYGPKSIEELLLSYGFVLVDNPDDTLILRLGAPSDVADRLAKQGLDVKQRFTLRKDGEIPQDLLRVMRGMMGGPVAHSHGDGCDHAHTDEGDEEEEDEEQDEHAAHEKEMEELQLEMDVLGTLGGMLEDKLEKLQVVVEVGLNVRESVKKMCEVYRQGQIDIILKTQDKLEERIERLERMVDQGIGGCPCGC